MRTLAQILLVVALVLSYTVSICAQEELWEELFSKFIRLYEQRRYSEAAKVAEEALKVAEKTFGPDHPDVATSQSFEITKKDIRRAAQAMALGKEPNPLHVDEEYAKKTKWGGIIAPPLFFFSFAYGEVPESQLREDGLPVGTEIDVPLPVSRAVGGASAVELGEPVRPGDTITVNRRVADVYCKQGKSGKLYFTVIESTYTNQGGHLVARELATFIQR
jgi:acyl dehydratase